MIETLEIPLIRVFRAARGDSFDDARRRKAELVTLDKSDLVRILSRCQTTLDAFEARAIRDAARAIPSGVGADIVLGAGRVAVTLRDRSGR